MPNARSTVGSTLSGATTGASIGSFFPGPGTVVGGVIGGGIGLLSGLLGGGGAPSDARDRVRALSASLAAARRPRSPFASATFQGRLGALTDALAQDRDDTAGRALHLGLSPGMAIAAGASARSRTLADGVRSAAGAAEREGDADRRFNLSLLMQALGLEASLDAQADARRADYLGTLTDAAAIAGPWLVEELGGARGGR